MTEQPAIVARDLAAGYGSRAIWTNANFTIPAGSFTAILGPNGSGKSTLVRLVLGLLPPASGVIKVLGEAPRRGNPLIGYVPQGSSFDPELSIRGRDFVALGVDGHKWGVRLAGRAQVENAVDSSISSVDARGYADRPLGRLSGGEQQRLLLAQALIGKPQLLPHIDHVLYVAHGKLAMGEPAEIITSESLSRIYSSPVEVLRDSRGRVFVVGLEEEVSHPHG